MPGRALAVFILTALILPLPPAGARGGLPTARRERRVARVPAPEDVMGFRPGDDRRLASWSGVVEYFSPRDIFGGHSRGSMPEEYAGGLGADGVRALREFVEQGGTLVCLNRASGFAIEHFDLPVRDLTAGLKRTEFYAPGAILRIELDRTHPVAEDEQQALKLALREKRKDYPYEKVPKESIAWVEDSPVFEVEDSPPAAARVRVIARYPQTGDPLLSGWLLGGEKLKGKAALVEVEMGKGRVYLFGFRPQYRGQSLATYPLFFNAILQTGGK